MLADTGKSKYAGLNGIESGEVKWTDGFWGDAVRSCAGNMVPQLQRMFEDKDISHVLENFRICAGLSQGDFDGTVFGDGDFYKWMESALYAAYLTDDKGLLDKLDEYIDLISQSQQEDGYLSTKQIIEAREGKSSRLKDINEFEVYNMGHLFTSACLHKRMTGKDNFLNVAKGAAAYLRKMYEDAQKNGEVQTAVCPSHYMGLIEMYRVTGDREYLDLAELAITLRDSVKNGMDDNQDRIPLKKHEKMIGHAVRGTYLYAGVADLYAETGDEDYLSMMHKVWNNMVGTKMYITGGIGALYNGCSPYGNFFVDQKIHQAFGYEYQLPNVTAYNETCASVGLVMWAYRMFLIEPKAEYFDIIERVMLNQNLAAVSLDGKKYFYENMLRRAKKLEYELIWSLTRSEYILSYCCPPNLARNIMQSAEYAYAAGRDTVWCGLYGASRAHIRLENGADFTISQTTEYPYDGRICFTFDNVLCGAKGDKPVKLMLRIPGWCERARLIVNGSEKELNDIRCGMYHEVCLEKLEGARVELMLDMPVRYTIANGMVEEDVFQTAVERGPIVYCVETPDTDAEYLEDIIIDPEKDVLTEWVEIEGRRLMALKLKADRIIRDDFDRSRLYQTLKKTEKVTTDVTMIPYFAWDNRGMGEMRIWFPYNAM